MYKEVTVGFLPSKFWSKPQNVSVGNRDFVVCMIKILAEIIMILVFLSQRSLHKLS